MLKFFVAVCLFVLVFSQDTCHNLQRMKLNEGDCNCRYQDSVGLNTIAIGWNIEKQGGKEGLRRVGANVDLIMSSSCYDGNKCASSKCSQCISESQKTQLYNVSIAESIACASRWLNNWNSLHGLAKSAIIDMAFNMGCGKLSGFRNLKAALERKDYKRAVVEMGDSQWCRQVGSRCKRNQDCMRSAQ
jgi:lysozyme